MAVGIATLGIAALTFDASRWYLDTIDSAERDAQNLVTVFADHTSRTVQPAYEALDVLEASVPGLLGSDRAAVERGLRARLANLPQLLWFAVATDTGQAIATMRPGIARDLGNLAGLPWFARYRAPSPEGLEGSAFGPLMKGTFTGDWFIPVTRAVRNPDGSLRAVIATAVDVRYFADLYRTIDVGPNGSITLLDGDGTIVARYPEHEGYVGRSAGDGRMLTELPRADRGRGRLTTVTTGGSMLGAYKRVPDYPLVVTVLYGAEDVFAVWRRSLPLYVAGALLICVFSVVGTVALANAVESANALAVAQKEIDMVHASERELARARESLAEAQRIGNMGNWEWNIETNELSWSDQVYRIFGLVPQEFAASYPRFLERVHCDDVASVETAVQRALNGEPYAVDHRIVRADGSVRIVHEEGEVVRNPAGAPVRMFGIVLDVTDQRQVERALRQSETRLAGILGIAPEAIIAVDERGIIQLFNAGAEQIFGQAALGVVGKPLALLIPEPYRERHVHMMRAFGDGEETSRLMSRRGRIIGLRADGREFPAEASIAKLQVGDERLFTVILRDISDRVAAEQVLIAAKEEAELSSRAKSEFLANMSHELRTPLNAIIGFSEIMHTEQFGPIGSSRYKAYADDIRSSGQHLLSVINDILDVSKIEAGRMELDESPVDLWRVIGASLTLVQGRAEQRNITLETTRSAGVMPVKADERKIKQIIINLLSNAVKFTPHGGTVSVAATVEQSWACIRIRDTGIGIPPDRLETIAQPFVQIDSGLNRRFEGTGLGLALSKALAELHQGTLSIESVLGTGTVVTLRLPPERLIDPEADNVRESGRRMRGTA
ncbi:MAG TPA: PAS domain S-box protein [Alphaproteobacteria bacterium]|nr:PAS domain S-box protein [Alphaproteobacteria bacterium]